MRRRPCMVCPCNKGTLPSSSLVHTPRWGVDQTTSDSSVEHSSSSPMTLYTVLLYWLIHAYFLHLTFSVSSYNNQLCPSLLWPYPCQWEHKDALISCKSLYAFWWNVSGCHLCTSDHTNDIHDNWRARPQWWWTDQIMMKRCWKPMPCHPQLWREWRKRSRF